MGLWFEELASRALEALPVIFLCFNYFLATTKMRHHKMFWELFYKIRVNFDKFV